MPPASPKLPAHLAFKSALVLLPPPSITPPIEAVRKVHDRNYERWPPHVNLIYPFLASPSEEVRQANDNLSPPLLKPEIRDRIRKVVGNTPPFNVSLTADPPGIFHHSKKSRTIWLATTAPHDSIQKLQTSLQEEFSECNAGNRPFRPHLSVGQATDDAQTDQVCQEVKTSILQFQPNENSEEPHQLAIDWLVDKVFVFERKGFKGRFQVVGAIELGR